MKVTRTWRIFSVRNKICIGITKRQPKNSQRASAEHSQHTLSSHCPSRSYPKSGTRTGHYHSIGDLIIFSITTLFGQITAQVTANQCEEFVCKRKLQVGTRRARQPEITLHGHITVARLLCTIESSSIPSWTSAPTEHIQRKVSYNMTSRQWIFNNPSVHSVSLLARTVSLTATNAQCHLLCRRQDSRERHAKLRHCFH